MWWCYDNISYSTPPYGNIDNASTKSKPRKGEIRTKFPVNKGNLIIHMYYLQMNVWYDVMHIPEVEHSAEHVTVLDGYKWKPTTPKTMILWNLPNRHAQEYHGNTYYTYVDI